MSEIRKGDSLMTVSQVAEFFAVTPYTVRSWLKDDDNPLIGIKVGHAWRVKESMVLDYANMKFGEDVK